ncbi:hypothetical protein FH972_005710 [Carpinus fangiana]|uniref:Uncharacterized protein n=1 Tax=Carpinus fangiana TaxID=176857 RepID=A0A5N6QTK9_9ROSI|nr:hypothetical protein FH972_005710 [Carpinus fangiana]
MPAFAEDLSSGLEPHGLVDLDTVPGQELREDAPEGSLLAHCFGLEAPFSCSHIYPLLLSFEFPFPVPLHTLFSSVGLRGTQETKHMSKTNTSYNLLHLGHLGERVVEEGLDIFGPGAGAGGRARGFEGSVEPGVEDLDGGVQGGGGEDARKLVGEDGDPDASSAGDEAPCVGGRGGDAFADLGGNGLIGRGAQILDVYAEGAQVRDERVFEGAAKGVCSGYDFVGAGRGGGRGHCGSVRIVSSKACSVEAVNRRSWDLQSMDPSERDLEGRNDNKIRFHVEPDK